MSCEDTNLGKGLFVRCVFGDRRRQGVRWVAVLRCVHALFGVEFGVSVFYASSGAV